MDVQSLKAAIVKSGNSQKEISVKLGVSYSSFNGKVNGRQEFTVSEVQKMIDILCLNDVCIFFEINSHK